LTDLSIGFLKIFFRFWNSFWHFRFLTKKLFDKIPKQESQKATKKPFFLQKAKTNILWKKKCCFLLKKVIKKRKKLHFFT